MQNIWKMIIAEQKKKENIAEYLVYMYQIEDLIRANNFDPQRIEQTIINNFDVSYDVKREMYEWYKGLIDRLISEGKEKIGHMKFLQEITDQLNELNSSLLHKPLNTELKDAYDKARKNLEALRLRSGNSNENEVQMAMNGIYGLLILKLQKKDITKETKAAFATITDWIALLTAEFMKQEEER